MSVCADIMAEITVLGHVAFILIPEKRHVWLSRHCIMVWNL
jgi:hypothetical protein